LGFSEIKVAKGTLIKAEVTFYFGACEVNALGEAAALEGEAFEMGLGASMASSSQRSKLRL
jgi:hypothetical protein